MRKIMSICLSLVIVIIAITASPRTVSANATDCLSDEEKTRIIQLGDMKYNSTDGSYVFVLNELVNAKTNARTQNSAIEYKSTTLILMPVTEEAGNNLSKQIDKLKSVESEETEIYSTAARAGGSNTVYDSDSAGCLSAYLTVQYSKITSYGKEYVKLTNVSGGYTADGSGARLSGGVFVERNYVIYGATGVGINGRGVEQYEEYEPGRTSRSFSVTPPSTWIAIAAESELATIGANYTITLKRGNEYWKCYLENNLAF